MWRKLKHLLKSMLPISSLDFARKDYLHKLLLFLTNGGGGLSANRTKERLTRNSSFPLGWNQGAQFALMVLDDTIQMAGSMGTSQSWAAW
jgi:hypothetical protein